MLSKFGKEKMFSRTNEFRVKYGTVDARKLSAIYVNIESWVEPIDDINFKHQRNKIRRDLILKLRNYIDLTFFHKDFIVDFDLRESGLRLKKKSFMVAELTLFPIKHESFNSLNIKSRVGDISANLISTIKENNFKFYAKKI